VNKLEILTHVSAFMVMFYTFVEHVLYGSLKMEIELLYHIQKLNTMQHLRLQKKIFLQRIYWRKLESNCNFQSTLNVTMSVPST
jgi:hypothetical protein